LLCDPIDATDRPSQPSTRGQSNAAEPNASPSSCHFAPARLHPIHPPTAAASRQPPNAADPSSAVTPRSPTPTPPSSGAGRQRRRRRRPTCGHGGSRTAATCWRRTTSIVLHVELTAGAGHGTHLISSPIPTSPRPVSRFHLVTPPAESLGFLVRRRRQGRPRPPGGARPHEFGVGRSCCWASGRTHNGEEGDALEMPGYRPPKKVFPPPHRLCRSPTID
jgi:hypothetical protein